MAEWASRVPTRLLGLLLFMAMLGATWLGARINLISERRRADGGISEAQQGYVLTSVYTLVGLLLAFTFGMAMERFARRRALVLQDATAIESLHFNAQFLPEPHRSRLSKLAVRHAQNHIALARTRKEDAETNRLLAENESLLDQLKASALPAFNAIRALDFSSSLVESISAVIRIDAERKAARRAQIPPGSIFLLMLYAVIAAIVLGAVMRKRRAEAVSVVLLALFVLAFMLLSDINRPISGLIQESQEPMEHMLGRIAPQGSVSSHALRCGSCANGSGFASIEAH